VEVSRKRPGIEAPAMHHTIEGAAPWFQVDTSATTREASFGSVTSAEKYWNFWEGDLAAA
jgi:hypothetical protein